MTKKRTEHDDDGQRFLREQVAEEIKEILTKHNLGGVVLLVSETAASWTTVHPKWSGLQPDPVYGVRLRMGRKVPHVNTDATMHLIASIREMCGDYSNFYGRLWRMAVDALTKSGVTVEHKPLARRESVGGRPDPFGGETE